MLKKDTIPVSFKEKYNNILYALRDFDDTLVFLG